MYEYHVIQSPLGRLLKQEELNLMGSDRWELIQIVGTSWYFKREKQVAPKPVTRKRNVKAEQ